jgi:hypothetical protein
MLTSSRDLCDHTLHAIVIRHLTDPSLWDSSVLGSKHARSSNNDSGYPATIILIS